jgi:hypothetical protein
LRLSERVQLSINLFGDFVAIVVLIVWQSTFRPKLTRFDHPSKSQLLRFNSLFPTLIRPESRPFPINSNSNSLLRFNVFYHHPNAICAERRFDHLQTLSALESLLIIRAESLTIVQRIAFLHEITYSIKSGTSQSREYLEIKTVELEITKRRPNDY